MLFIIKCCFVISADVPRGDRHGALRFNRPRELGVGRLRCGHEREAGAHVSNVTISTVPVLSVSSLQETV